MFLFSLIPMFCRELPNHDLISTHTIQTAICVIIHHQQPQTQKHTSKGECNL